MEGKHFVREILLRHDEKFPSIHQLRQGSGCGKGKNCYVIICDAVKKCQFRFRLNRSGRELTRKPLSLPKINFHQHFFPPASLRFHLRLENLIQFCTFSPPSLSLASPFDNILWNCVNMYRDVVHCQTSSEPAWTKAANKKRWWRWETSFLLPNMMMQMAEE